MIKMSKWFWRWWWLTMAWSLMLGVLALFNVQLSNHIGGLVLDIDMPIKWMVPLVVPPSVVCLFWWVWS
jgi:hypothetical protein